jgi:hypothetical protein
MPSLTDGIAVALAAALNNRRQPPLVLVARGTSPIRALVDDLTEPVVAVAGDSARILAAAGVAAAGEDVVVQVGRDVRLTAGEGAVLGITADRAVAVAALAAGWPVVQPALPGDVGPLLDEVPRTALVLVGPAAAADEPVPSAAGLQPRMWHDGDSVALVVSGADVDAALPIARMLRARSVRAAVAEVPVLTAPAQAPLLQPATLWVGPASILETVAAGGWDSDRLTPVSVGSRAASEVVSDIEAAVG